MTKQAKSAPFKIASPPFESKPSADVALRTGDNVAFYVRKGILAEASSIFEDMFSIPQPPQPGPVETTTNDEGIPAINVTETSDTIDYLLRVCYPIENPRLPDGEAVLIAIQAARKYMMDYVVAEAQKQFVTLANVEPVRMYALACKHNMHEEMRLAARASLALPLEDADSLGQGYIKELDEISANAYLRLRAYHKRCGAGVSKLCYCDKAPGQRGWTATPPARSSNFGDRNWEKVFTDWARPLLKTRPYPQLITTSSTITNFLTENIGTGRIAGSNFQYISRDLNVFTEAFADAIREAVDAIKLEIA